MHKKKIEQNNYVAQNEQKIKINNEKLVMKWSFPKFNSNFYLSQAQHNLQVHTKKRDRRKMMYVSVF